MALSKQDKLQMAQITAACIADALKEFVDPRFEKLDKKVDKNHEKSILFAQKNQEELLALIGHYFNESAKAGDVKELKVKVARLEELTAK